MATLTLALMTPGGTKPLQVPLEVTITTEDGVLLDQANHEILGGGDTIEPGATEYIGADLTALGKIPADAVYRIASDWSGELRGREWFWDGHADADLADLPTGPPGTTGIVIERYDDTELRQMIAEFEQGAAYDDTDLRADVAQGDAETLAAAKNDATSKANTARDSAVSTAATDATSKANAARDASTPIAHATDTTNPHAVTKAQVGLGLANNTPDSAKPVSGPQQAALDAKADLVGGKLVTSQIPSIATHETVAVDSKAAMLALTTTQVQPGDEAIIGTAAPKADQGRWVLFNPDPAQLSSWIHLPTTSAVDSINGQTGVVVLGASDVGALTKADNLSDVPSKSTARANLGLGSAATRPATDFDAAGAAQTVADGALTKTQNLADLPSKSAARSNLGLGSAATAAASDFQGASDAATRFGMRQPMPAFPVGAWIHQGAVTLLTSGQANGVAVFAPMWLPGGSYDAIRFNLNVAGSAGAVLRAIFYADPADGLTFGVPLLEVPGIDATGSTGARTAVFPSLLVIPTGGAMIQIAMPTQGAPSTLPQLACTNVSTMTPISTSLPDLSSAAPNLLLTGITGAAPSNVAAAPTSIRAPRVAFRRAA